MLPGTGCNPQTASALQSAAAVVDMLRSDSGSASGRTESSENRDSNYGRNEPRYEQEVTTERSKTPRELRIERREDRRDARHERREERRDARHERREERRDARHERREERREARQERWLGM